MSVIPSGVAVDPAAAQRIADLVRLVRAAVDNLSELENSLSWRSARRTRRYYQQRIAEANRTIDALLSVESGNATGAMAEWARQHFPATYGTGATRALGDLAIQGISPITGDVRIHTQVVESLVARFQGTAAVEMVVPLKTSLVRSARVLVSDGFASDIATGILGGAPRTEASARLRRSFTRALSEQLMEGEEPDLTRIQVGKRTTSLDAWAEMYARTESARASTAGTRVVATQNDVRHIIVTSHAHNPCICTPFEGRVFALNEGDDRFPHVSTLPGGGCPMHPNCVHREAPAVVSFFADRGDLEGRDRVPDQYSGLDEQELARRIRRDAKELAKYSTDRDGYLPADSKAAA